MRRRDSRIGRLMDDTLVVGLVILGITAIVLAITSRAQNGLPWEPTYDITVAVPDAGKLSRNAEARIGGARVGQVLEIDAAPPRGKQPPHALLKVQLEEKAGPLPVDTRVEVRVASVLGGKFLDIVPGHSERTVPQDGQLPLRNAKTSVDLDEAFQIFDPEGRRSVQKVIRELGYAFAGRGGQINDTIATMPRALPPLQRVLATLNAPQTDTPGFLRGAVAASTALAPLAGELSDLTVDAATTMGALDDDALGESIEALPGAAGAGESALRAMQPVLDDAEAITRDLRPAAGMLRPATRRLSSAMRTAIRVDPEMAKLDKPLDSVLRAVRKFNDNPSSTASLRLLGSTDLATFGASAFLGLGAILNTTWEAEEHCRTITKWIAGLRDVTSDGDAGGNWLRMIPIFNNDETFPADKPDEGLHFNPYPNQNAQECEAGNAPWAPGQKIGSVKGLQGAVR